MAKLDSTTQKIRRQYVTFRPSLNIPGESGMVYLNQKPELCHIGAINHTAQYDQAIKLPPTGWLSC